MQEPTNNTAFGYLARKGDQLVMTDWRGKTLGSARITGSWATPRSHISDRMYQIEARIDGVLYTGRCAGLAMVWRGKPCAGSRART